MARKRDKGVVVALREAFMQVTMQLLGKLTREHPESVAFHRSYKQPAPKRFTEVALKEAGCMRPLYEASTDRWVACKAIPKISPGTTHGWLCFIHEREVPGLWTDNRQGRTKPKAGVKLRPDDKVDCRDIVEFERIAIGYGSGVKLGRLGTVKAEELGDMEEAAS